MRDEPQEIESSGKLRKKVDDLLDEVKDRYKADPETSLAIVRDCEEVLRLIDRGGIKAAKEMTDRPYREAADPMYESEIMQTQRLHYNKLMRLAAEYVGALSKERLQ